MEIDVTSAAKKTRTPAERMAAYRQRKKDAGLRLVQIWLPDLRNPLVLAEFQRQAKAIGQSDPAGDEIMEWLDQVRDWPED